MTIPAFEPDEVSTGESTRAARLKWVIVVDSEVPAGRMVNAVACVSASVGAAITGLIGPSGADAAGSDHAGLPWAGCSILSADGAQLRQLRAKAAGHAEMFVADMPVAAQTNRVYDEYLAELAGADDPELIAVGIVGPRNAVDRLVKRLPLLG